MSARPAPPRYGPCPAFLLDPFIDHAFVILAGTHGLAAPNTAPCCAPSNPRPRPAPALSPQEFLSIIHDEPNPFGGPNGGGGGLGRAEPGGAGPSGRASSRGLYRHTSCSGRTAQRHVCVQEGRIYIRTEKKA